MSYKTALLTKAKAYKLANPHYPKSMGKYTMVYLHIEISV